MIQRLKKKLYGFIEAYFLEGCSNYNSLAVRRSSRTKQKARDMFLSHNIPVAQGLAFINPFRALSFVRKHGFPVVIKPNLGGFSRGSFFPIRTYRDLWKALFWVKFYWPKTIIEQYAEGKNYRVTALDGNVIAVARRYPPQVLGDGINTIENLIEKENKVRARMNLCPVISPLSTGKRTQKYLKKQGLNLKSILEEDQRVDLFHRIALSPGGSIETIDISTITPKNKKLFKQILDLFEARIFGIDIIMSQGIDVDYDEQDSVLLEVNSRPYLKLHEYPRYGEKPDLSSHYKDLDTLTIEENDIF